MEETLLTRSTQTLNGFLPGPCLVTSTTRVQISSVAFAYKNLFIQSNYPINMNGIDSGNELPFLIKYSECDTAVRPKGTLVHGMEETGIEPPTFCLADNPLYWATAVTLS